MAAFPPPLHSRVVPMPQGASDRADTASLPDKLCMIHTQDIRTCVRGVNVENVRRLCEEAYVPDESTLGAKLRAIREESGLSLAILAKQAGYAQASSIQRYFSDDYDAETLPVDIARKLAKGFDGRINRDRIFALTGYEVEPEAEVRKYEGASAVELPRDVPVYGTALGAPCEIDGEAIEQTELNESNIITYFRRPTVLNHRGDVYGVYIQGSSMAPRFGEGETAFAESQRPPRVGDDVIVYLRVPDDHDNERVCAVLIKRLVRRTAAYIELEQFNPAKTFKLDAHRVQKIHRVIPWSELLS